MKKFIYISLFSFLFLMSSKVGAVSFNETSPYNANGQGINASVQLICSTGNTFNLFNSNNVHFGSEVCGDNLLPAFGNGTYKIVECLGTEEGNCLSYDNFNDYLSSPDFIDYKTFSFTNTGMSIACPDIEALNYKQDFNEIFNYDTMPSSCRYEGQSVLSGGIFFKNDIDGKPQTSDLIASVGSAVSTTMGDISPILSITLGIIFGFIGIVGVVNIVKEVRQKNDK